jgi:hypothetical protein
MNCCVVPRAVETVEGPIAIDTNVGTVTVKMADPLTEPEVAPILVVPCPRLVARPALLIVAVPIADDVHVTEGVKFCVLPSVYVPVAVNCCVFPWAIDEAAGLSAIETSVGAVTVSIVEPLTEPDVAVIVVTPCP